MNRDLESRTFVITGANTGIGKATALELARRGAHVVLACRNRAKTEPVVEEIRRAAANPRVEFIALDLADLSQVRACAAELVARELPIHGLINNAGLAGQRGTTKDGFELLFGTNHLGPYLFTRLLADVVIRTATAAGEARIVNLASELHYRARGIDWSTLQSPTRTRTTIPEYAVSKLATVLFTKELARRLAGTRVTTYAVHPGAVASDIWRRLPRPVRWAIHRFLISPEEGAVATLRCATAPELSSQTGRYYDVGGKERSPNRLSDDVALAHALWSRSAGWVGLPE